MIATVVLAGRFAALEGRENDDTHSSKGTAETQLSQCPYPIRRLFVGFVHG
jgi:hypothetical protein